MGLTVGYARCHDHKFDPIPTQDYYSLAAAYQGSSLHRRRSRRACAARHAKFVEETKQREAALANWVKDQGRRLSEERLASRVDGTGPFIEGPGQAAPPSWGLRTMSPSCWNNPTLFASAHRRDPQRVRFAKRPRWPGDRVGHCAAPGAAGGPGAPGPAARSPGDPQVAIRSVRRRAVAPFRRADLERRTPPLGFDSCRSLRPRNWLRLVGIGDRGDAARRPAEDSSGRPGGRWPRPRPAAYGRRSRTGLRPPKRLSCSAGRRSLFLGG